MLYLNNYKYNSIFMIISYTYSYLNVLHNILLYYSAVSLPIIETQINAVQAVQGRQAKFEVKVNGQPKPTVTW